jgi:uncharacterized protein (DUF3084 family)
VSIPNHHPSEKLPIRAQVRALRTELHTAHTTNGNMKTRWAKDRAERDALRLELKAVCRQLADANACISLQKDMIVMLRERVKVGEGALKLAKQASK